VCSILRNRFLSSVHRDYVPFQGRGNTFSARSAGWTRAGTNWEGELTMRDAGGKADTKVEN